MAQSNFFHRISFLSIFLVTLSGCDGLSTPRNGELHYTGVIDDDLVELLKGSSIEDVKKIIIDSPGGSTNSALEAAHIIQKHDIIIEVDGDCFSACAEILLPTNKKNIVKRNSLIGYHYNLGSFYFINDYMERHLGKSIRETELYEQSLKVIGIMKRSGINPDLLVAMLINQGGCINFEKLSSEDSAYRTSVHLGVDLYVPNEKLLSQFEWTFGEFHQPSDSQHDEIFERVFEKYPDVSAMRIEKASHQWDGRLIEEGIEIKRIAECTE